MKKILIVLVMMIGLTSIFAQKNVFPNGMYFSLPQHYVGEYVDNRMKTDSGKMYVLVFPNPIKIENHSKIEVYGFVQATPLQTINVSDLKVNGIFQYFFPGIVVK